MPDAPTTTPDTAPTPGRRLFEVVTVGLPFSTFKLLGGLHLAAQPVTLVRLLGVLIAVLGVVDLTLNVTNVVGLLVRRRTIGPLCLLHGVIGGRRGPALEELGLAIDTVIAFLIVAGMIAWSRLPLLTPSHGAFWNVAVILNVLGAGALRLRDAVTRARRGTQA